MFRVALFVGRPFFGVNFLFVNSKELRNFVCFKAVL